MLKRGFKTWCERLAITYRKALRLQNHSPLCPHMLAEYLKVQILTPKDIPGLSTSDINLLLKNNNDSWSAVTISNANSNLIIYNNAHAQSRQSNDIMHELSHIINRHRPQTTHYFQETNIFLRQYNKNQEEEADCLAATLLLPKDALMRVRFSKKTIAIAAKEYAVSQRLLQMRLNTSGVSKIFARANKKIERCVS